MTVASSPSRYVERPSPSSLADVIDTILDKGLVIDVYLRASLLGIEVIAVDARIVVASVDTYLRFAEAVNRLDLTQTEADVADLWEGVNQAGAQAVTRRAIDRAIDKVTDWLPGGGKDT